MLLLLLQQNFGKTFKKNNFGKYFMPWQERKNSCANNPVATEHKQYKCFSKKKNKNSSQYFCNKLSKLAKSSKSLVIFRI